MSTKPATDGIAPSTVRELKPHIHAIRPLLKHDDFTLEETDVELVDKRNYDDNIKSVLRKMLSNGVLKKQNTKEVRRGNARWRYRWAQGAREKLQAYAEEMNQLPCGCRAHIGPKKDAPDGERTCKYCGETHPKDVIREAMP